VDIAPLRLGIELGRGDDADAATLALGDRFRDAEQRVVIGEGLDPDAARRSPRDELRRSECTV
jgi:hypothetical protein